MSRLDRAASAFFLLLKPQSCTACGKRIWPWQEWCHLFEQLHHRGCAWTTVSRRMDAA